MKQIVDKLNNIAKAIDENVELPTTDLIVDSLDAITRAYGGTPSDSNLIVDKLEDIEEVAHGGITPTGNIEITENTTEPLDIAQYATATVNVSGGGDKNYTLLEETTIITVEDSGFNVVMLDLEIPPYDSLIVVYDGTKYTAPLHDGSYGAKGSDWGEYPFAIFLGDETAILTQTAGNHTIEISTPKVQTLVPLQTMEPASMYGAYAAQFVDVNVDLIDTLSLPLETLLVTFDGTDYELPFNESEPSLYGATYNGETWDFSTYPVAVDGKFQGAFVSNADEHTIIVKADVFTEPEPSGRPTTIFEESNVTPHNNVIELTNISLGYSQLTITFDYETYRNVPMVNYSYGDANLQEYPFYITWDSDYVFSTVTVADNYEHILGIVYEPTELFPYDKVMLYKRGKYDVSGYASAEVTEQGPNWNNYFKLQITISNAAGSTSNASIHYLHATRADFGYTVQNLNAGNSQQFTAPLGGRFFIVPAYERGYTISVTSNSGCDYRTTAYDSNSSHTSTGIEVNLTNDAAHLASITISITGGNSQ